MTLTEPLGYCCPAFHLHIPAASGAVTGKREKKIEQPPNTGKQAPRMSGVGKRREWQMFSRGAYQGWVRVAARL